ncbi:MAG: ATP-dependent zinc metalloprotease FtsH [Candidatus Omnitrophica bacterium]|nr:ATP-dependent zinc metalloprotease FtsH [Candidatus Omnitrophota bacterium]
MLLATFIFLYYGSLTYKGTPLKLSYSEFFDLLQSAQTRGATVKTAIMSEEQIKGELVDGAPYVVNVVPDDEELRNLLREKTLTFTIEPARTLWLNLFYTFSPILLFIGFLWFFVYRGAQGGGRILSFGKSKARLMSGDQAKVTFNDVAGVDEAKEELREVIEFLKDPKRFQRLGGKIPKGVLLMGPPGTGKTLLAKAVSGEAGVPFFSISGSDFVEMFVGVGASRVRDLFEQAKRSSKASGKGCIIFIDEIDAVGRQRFAGIGGGHDEREQTLNALLVEMDGFNTQEGVILIAATNRPDVLDPALLRPGRFDRQIVIDRPDIKGREAILKVHVRDIKLAAEVDLISIARQTPGFSGADLANLANEAALLAARRDKDSVSMEELEAAIERVMAGPERKSRVISNYEKKIVAHHEAGHALLSLTVEGADPLHKVSIIPRGTAALGYTMQMPLEDRYILTRTELVGRLIVLLGGRASEELLFHEVTTGAQNDLEVATEIARRMVCRFGMSARLGHLTFGRRQEQIFLGRDLIEERNYSESTARVIDEEVKRVVDECYQKARQTLEKHKDKLQHLADELLKKEVLDGREVRKLVGLGVEPEEKEEPGEVLPPTDIWDGKDPGEQGSTSNATE